MSIGDMAVKFAQTHWGIAKIELLYMGLLKGKPNTEPKIRFTRLKTLPIMTVDEKKQKQEWIAKMKSKYFLESFGNSQKDHFAYKYPVRLDTLFRPPLFIGRMNQVFHGGLSHINIKEFPEGTDITHEILREVRTGYKISFKDTGQGYFFYGSPKKVSSTKLNDYFAVWANGHYIVTIDSTNKSAFIINEIIKMQLKKLPSTLDKNLTFDARKWIGQEIARCFARMELCIKHGKPMRVDWFARNIRIILRYAEIPKAKRNFSIEYDKFDTEKRKQVLKEIKSLWNKYRNDFEMSEDTGTLILKD